MPYLVKDRGHGEEIIRKNVCSICGRRLYLFTDGKYDGQKWVACNEGHSSIERVHKGTPKEIELARSLELANEVITPQETNALVSQGIPMTGIITQDQATQILNTVWKGAPEIEVYKAAMLCQDFGLHPLMKHVYLIPFNKGKQDESWSVVLGIGATRLIMSRLGSFGYTDDTPRMMSEDEQMKIFGKVDKDNIVAITRLRTRDGLEANGYGKWPTAKNVLGSDKGNTKENMAFIRSERNAFSRLFPDANTPKASIEVVDERYMPTPSGIVDTETGELQEPQEPQEPIDAEFEEITPEQEEPKPEKAPEKTGGIEMPWLIEAVNSLKFDILGHMRDKYKVECSGTLGDVVDRLSRDQQEELVKVVQNRLDSQ